MPTGAYRPAGSGGPAPAFSVIDSLLSSSGADALSANQGRILAIGVYDSRAEQAANFTATARGSYPVNVTGGSVTVTPPAAPTAGQIFQVTDSRGNASDTNKIEVDFSASLLHGTAQSVEITKPKGTLSFVYRNATVGWTSTESYLGSNASGLEIAPEENADFTAAVGLEYPIDATAIALGGSLVVTAPASPAVGDSFAVFDSRLVCGDGVVNPLRMIRVEVAENLHGLPGPESTVINSAGARLELTYIDATVGWRVASNVNN